MKCRVYISTVTLSSEDFKPLVKVEAWWGIICLMLAIKSRLFWRKEGAPVFLFWWVDTESCRAAQAIAQKIFTRLARMARGSGYLHRRCCDAAIAIIRPFIGSDLARPFKCRTPVSLTVEAEAERGAGSVSSDDVTEAAPWSPENRYKIGRNGAWQTIM